MTSKKATRGKDVGKGGHDKLSASHVWYRAEYSTCKWRRKDVQQKRRHKTMRGFCITWLVKSSPPSIYFYHYKYILYIVLGMARSGNLTPESSEIKRRVRNTDPFNQIKCRGKVPRYFNSDRTPCLHLSPRYGFMVITGLYNRSKRVYGELVWYHFDQEKLMISMVVLLFV